MDNSLVGDRRITTVDHVYVPWYGQGIEHRDATEIEWYGVRLTST